MTVEVVRGKQKGDSLSGRHGYGMARLVRRYHTVPRLACGVVWRQEEVTKLATEYNKKQTELSEALRLKDKVGECLQASTDACLVAS